MEGIRVKSKTVRRGTVKGDWDYESTEEWRLATGRMNHHSFQLEDWIPYSYFEMAEDEHQAMWR